jgi:hypothetical protein
MIYHFARPLIALSAGYGLVLAIFLSSVAAGQTAHSTANICISSVRSGGDDRTPTQHENHDLACLTVCGVAMAGFALPVSTVVAPSASSFVSWRGQIIGLIQANTLGSLSARGPPAQV